jgi:hypothetical protein
MKRLLLGVSMVAVLALGPMAWAQTIDTTTSQTQGTNQTTEPADPTDPTALAVSDTVTVPVRALVQTALPAEPSPVSFGLGSAVIEGIDPTLTQGVTFEGYARKVEVPVTDGTTKIGQVLVMSVAKGDRTEQIDAQGLTAQFEADEDALFPDKPITVQGNRPALIAALQRLAEDDAPEETVVKDDSSDDDSSDGAASNAARNDDLASYQAPDAEKVVPEDEPVTTVNVTVEGCEMRIDETQGVAIQQSRTETLEDGIVIDRGTCTDSEQRYTLKQTYTGCPDEVDLEELTAWPQFKTVYLDGKGVTTTVSDCTPDTDTPFSISENTKTCPVSVNLPERQAIVQSVLTYKDRSGKTVQARGCEPSETVGPLPMTQDTSSCQLRHDFAAGGSEELGMWVYTLEGQPYQATPCLPTGRTFPHTIVTSANGQYICQPVVVGADVLILGRTEIAVDGVKQYISECAPVESATQTLQSTTDGCMDISAWTHDIEGSVSYGQERFFYLKPNGTREYVTECQTSDVTYLHDLTPVSWQYHDDALFAYRLYTISIKVGGVDQVIAVSQLRPGAAQFPYIEYGVTYQGTGVFSYEGCEKFEATEKVTAYTRPDGTTYTKPMGPGTAKKVGDVCTTSRPDVSSKWELYDFSHTALIGAGTARSYCRFTATRTVTREDGTVVLEEPAYKVGVGRTNDAVSTDGTGFAYCTSGFGGCPRTIADAYAVNTYGGSATFEQLCPNAHPTDAEVDTWLGELGW